MSVLNQSGEEQVECPLCMEPLEVDDLNFFPCTCGYQICRFCWHRIRTDENGLCPACRKGYPENPADFKPLSQEEVAKLKAEKRHKDQQRKQKVTENRKHLANVRVVQRNLVFVVGLPMRLADSEILKKHEYFGKFGKIHKVVINQCTSYAGTQGPSASAYVTYQRGDDALRAIQAVNNISVDGRSVKSSLGTTKYCSHFMKNQSCPKPDCMYLHEQGDTEASFTKEEMQQGKHQEYEKKLHDSLISASAGQRKPTPSPPALAASAPAPAPGVVSPTQAASAAGGKDAWPSLQGGPNGTGGSNGTATTNGNGGITKGENGRKQNCTKGNTNNSKKRHSSPDDHRSRSKDVLSLDETEGESLSLEEDNGSSGLDARSTSDSTESTDSSDESCAPGPCIAPATRLGAALFEPDNNSSFFSANSFTKLANTTLGSGVDWQANGLAPHMPDSLMPTVHPTEDWQAAFGFVAKPPSPHDHPSHMGHHGNPDHMSHHGNPHHMGHHNNDHMGHHNNDHLGHHSNDHLGHHSNDHLGHHSNDHLGHHSNDHLGHHSNDHLGHHSNDHLGHHGNDHLGHHGNDHLGHHGNDHLGHHGNDHLGHHGNDHLGHHGNDHLGHHGNEHMGHHGNLDHMSRQRVSSVPFDGARDGGHLFSALHSQFGAGALVQAPAPQPTAYRQRFSPESNGVTTGASKFFSDYHTQQEFASPEPASLYKPRNDFMASNLHMELNPRYDPAPRSFAEFRASPGSPAVTAESPPTDDWGFDLFHETQKALAEMMEKEAAGRFFHAAGQQSFQTPSFGGSKLLAGFAPPAPQPAQPAQPTSHRSAASGCSRLLDGLGLGNSSAASARPRLPPPGFAAPNHMNAFGLGIPRSKLGQSGPLGQAGNGSATSHMFPPGNAGGGGAFNGGCKDWTDNLHAAFPASATQDTSPQGHARYASAQQTNPAKGWTGPCTDWTALDPAIVSSSRPAPLPSASANASAVFPAAHWLRRLEERSFLAPPPHAPSVPDWASAPPPGFAVRQAAKVGEAKMENA